MKFELCLYRMSRRKRWEEISITALVSSMMRISPNYLDWNEVKGWRNPESLWGKLAQLTLNSNADTDRNWLYVVWKRNGQGIQV